MKPASIRRQVIALLALSLGMIGMAAYYEVGRDKDDRLSEAQGSTVLQAQTFAVNSLSTIKRIDETLLDLRLHWLTDQKEFSGVIQRRQSDIADIAFQVGVIDAGGYLIYSNLARSTGNIFLGEREHYLTHKQSGRDRLFISKPVFGKLSGKWAIQFTRPIFDRNRFAGVLVISVSPETFARFHDNLPLAKSGVTTMVAADGEIMARFPDDGSPIGKKVSEVPYLLPSAPIAGYFQRIAQVDQVERIYGYYRLPDYGLTFTVGRAVEDILAPHATHRRNVVALATVICAVVIVLIYLLYRTLSDQYQEMGIRARLAAIVEGSNDAIIGANLSGSITAWNAGAERMFGYSTAWAIGKSLNILHPPGLKEAAQDLLARLTSGEAISHYETRRRHRKGHDIEVELNAFPVRDQRGEIAGVAAILSDITERKRAEANLRLSSSVFANSYEGIVITDAGSVIVDVNPAFTRITGYSREEAIGQSPRLLSSGRQGTEFYARMWQSLAAHDLWRGEIWNRRKNGEVYAEMLSISAVRDDAGALQHYIGVFSDINQIKAHERELDRIAHYDVLTGVPNRRLLADRMGQAIARARRNSKSLAVCYLDLDGFKPINDQYGHAAGDRLLVEITERLKGVLRADDTLARLGGDEFVLLFTDLAQPQESHFVLDRVLAAVSTPVLVDDRHISLSASIGVTLYPADDVDADALLRHADQAMYLAKEKGKNCYHLFDADRNRQAQADRDHLQRLREALENDEFVLHYQPKVDLVSGNVIGAEALIRWQHPQQGLLSPAEFLHYLDGSDLEIAVGEWVIESVLEQIATWQALGLTFAVSANVSADHLLQANFSERLLLALERHPEVPAARLELEILETVALTDMSQAVQALTRCRQIGVHFALDDFGTGYSSLTYFRNLPVETLKIDQSFVRDMLDDPDDLGIVESVVRLAQAFNRLVIAEGVETLEHAAMLIHHLGCRLAQGYGIARPMPAAQLPDWVNKWRDEAVWLTFDRGLTNGKDATLMVAAQSQRNWIEKIVDHLEHPEDEAIRGLNLGESRFGRWYQGSGMARYGRFPEYQAIAPLHERVHRLADEIVAAARNGELGVARQRLPELYVASEKLLLQVDALERADNSSE